VIFSPPNASKTQTLWQVIYKAVSTVHEQAIKTTIGNNLLPASVVWRTAHEVAFLATDEGSAAYNDQIRFDVCK